MKVDPRALAGIERKIARADEHLVVLHEQMLAWDARQPWRLVPETHDQGRKHVVRLRFLEPIPVDWAVILGEAIHNLRSALDQAVYWLTVEWNGAPLQGTSFPVYRRKRDFMASNKKPPRGWSSSGGMYKIRGVGPGPHTFIERLQPYPQRDRWFYCRDLRTVHDLWNQDKHRLVHLWGLRFSDVQLFFEQGFAAECVVGIDRRVLHEGAIVLTARCRSPHAEMKMGRQSRMTANLAFFSGTRRGAAERQESLWDTVSSVSDVIRKLVNAIGRQDAPINLDAWTKGRWR